MTANPTGTEARSASFTGRKPAHRTALPQTDLMMRTTAPRLLCCRPVAVTSV